MTSAQITFHCPQCAQTTILTLEEFRELGAPHCPDHPPVAMVAEADEGDVTKAVGMIMNGVTVLAAKALSWPFGRKDA